MSRRLLKQIIYGSIFLGMIAGIFYGGFSFFSSATASCFDSKQNQNEEGIDCGGSCEPCALKNIRPIAADVELLKVNGSVSAIISLTNPNIVFGADDFTYTLNIYGVDGAKVVSISKNSFIYPAETNRIIIEPNIKLSTDLIRKPELIITDPNWVPAEQFKRPVIQTRQVKAEVANQLITVTGLVSNRESFGIPRSNVGALAFKAISGSRQLIGVSKTLLQDIRPFEERAFKIVIPVAEPITSKDLSIDVTVDARR